ncbi:MAG: aminotransferase class V-fold PLP-dependent enzyme [Clostridiaceae bacterium]|nr:aminotransferase class V-fold PLP-dependent enzyme [Eubacteriales bacterium]
MEKNYISMVPGPTQIDERILNAMTRQIMTHINEGWADFYINTCNKMKRVLMTTGDCFLINCSGTGGVECALTSTVAPGEKILVLSNGLFGDRIANIAKGYQLEAETIRFSNQEALSPGALRSRLSQGLGNIAAVGAVFSESQNGILNPIREIAAICNEYDVPLIVDTISATGGIEYRMDEWGVDFTVASMQKCLGGVVGVACVAVNDKAWKYIENKKTLGFYYDLRTWRRFMHTPGVVHPHPWSMSETLIFGVDKACDLMLEEGLENRWKRHVDLYEYYVRELTRLGFEMFLPREIACPTVISIHAHPAIGANEMAERLKKDCNIMVGSGIDEQKGKIWRIGNMAEQARKEKADLLLTAVSSLLASLK